MACDLSDISDVAAGVTRNVDHPQGIMNAFKPDIIAFGKWHMHGGDGFACRTIDFGHGIHAIGVCSVGEQLFNAADMVGMMVRDQNGTYR